MKTYIVFGDPRRTENARTFTADLNPQNITIDGSHGTVTIGGRSFAGAVLSHQERHLGADSPPHVSMLISEALPSDDISDMLTRNGWSVTNTAPRNVTVPFNVETFLLVQHDGEFTIHTARLWMDRTLVPTQRITANPPSGIAFPATVLSMEVQEEGASPLAILTTKSEHVTTDSNGDIPGWQPFPFIPVQQKWKDMARVSEAVEAKVQYLLTSPVVVGVELHNLDFLTKDDITTVLPADVAEELVAALDEAGRHDLIPE